MLNEDRIDQLRRRIARSRDLTDNYPPFTVQWVDIIMYLNNCLLLTDNPTEFDEYMAQQDQHWSDFYE